MSFEELEQALERGYAPTFPNALPSAELEAQLLRQFDAQMAERGDPVLAGAPAASGPAPRGGIVRFLRAHRSMVAAAASFAVLVGACALPAEIQTELGIGLTIVAPHGVELPVEAIARAAAEGSGAEQVSVEATMSPQMQRVQIGLWGADVGVGQVTAQLRDEFPELEGVKIQDEALEGSIETNLGGKLIHGLFDSAIAEDDVEAARARVVASLRARGIDGDVSVEVRDGPDGRQIKVGVRQTHEGSAPDAAGHERRIRMRRFGNPDGTQADEDVDIQETIVDPPTESP